MKKKTRLTALVLTLCMLASALTLPAGAASAAVTSFSDIADTETAVSVECLRLLGVLDGYADGQFRPDASLTRAQFCKMAVYALNAGAELGKYRATTIFPDVRPSHWASSYINLAAKGKKVIAGFADGYFRPDRTVTYGQAVTILMRMLGYTDADVGAVWPDGYLAQAEVTGLTDGLDISAGTALSRGSAARLFANLLRCDTKESGAYAKTVAAGTVDGVMLVSSAASASDGVNSALQIGGGSTYQLANRESSNGLLNGRMGTLLLDKQNKALTFVPDAVGSARTVVVSAAAAEKLTDTNGSVYAIPSETKTYYNGEQKTWGEVYSWLTAGSALTLYLGASGGVEYVFTGGGATASQAVIVYSSGSTAGFDALTGGAAGYRIYKDGSAATAADLRAYDVVTFSSATNSLRVCDVRLTGVLESVTPSPEAATSLTLMGRSFSVLPSARDMLSGYKAGSVVTLLLTEDNQVAGVVRNAAAPGNARGFVKTSSGSSVTVSLLCGIEVTGTVSGTAFSEGQLVRVSSSKAGVLSLSKLTGGVTGQLDVAKRTLGGQALADNVVIYRSGSAGLTAVGLSQLGASTVSASEIAYAGTDWAGKVNLIVLGGNTGVSYYGRAIFRTGEKIWVPDEGHEDEDPTLGNGHYKSGESTLAVECGDTVIGPLKSTYTVSNGSFVRVTLSADKTRYTSVLTLTALRKVANSAWSGQTAVTAGGKTYAVPSDVLCYNADSGSWVSLSQAHAYASVCTLYTENSVVRIIEVAR